MQEMGTSASHAYNEHRILLVTVFLHQSERLHFTHMQNKWQNNCVEKVVFNILELLEFITVFELNNNKHFQNPFVDFVHEPHSIY
jgi:hypothetical protein